MGSMAARLFGVMPNCARIDQHDGSFFGIFGSDQPAVLQMTSHLVGVGDIHLTAKSLEVNAGAHYS